MRIKMAKKRLELSFETWDLCDFEIVQKVVKAHGRR